MVLALVEGPTLADRIDAGALVQGEALSVAKQIIDALEYARIRDHRPRLAGVYCEAVRRGANSFEKR